MLESPIMHPRRFPDDGSFDYSDWQGTDFQGEQDLLEMKISVFFFFFSWTI